jgi:two-component system, NtrC family, nitrogen regulation response regulator GlnG
MPRLLIVDDEPSICWALRRVAQTLGHDAVAASPAEEALQIVSTERFDAAVVDVRLPGADGLSLMPQLRRRLGDVPLVVITAYGDLPTAVEALRRGAFEYLVKPFDLAVAERVLARALSVATVMPAAAAPSPPAAADTLVGNTPAMQQVYKQIALAAANNSCVHLHGESGTGKELVARAIHRYGRRASGPFVAVNVASLSESLVESELFGHVRGAFTGAAESRRGVLEQADGGTIFLDEVAEVPLAVQVKLLRALEYGEVTPVGGGPSVRVDFRIISATHQNLGERVAAGAFRRDLYFRLNTFEIKLPLLRERREDIALLTNHFLDLLAAKAGTPRPRMSEETLDELRRRPWEGNIRELRNAVEYAMMLARGGVILPEHLPPPVVAPATSGSAGASIETALREWAREQWSADKQPSDVYRRLLELVEPPVLEVALEQHQGQLASAARSLGLHRMTLSKKVARTPRERAE